MKIDLHKFENIAKEEQKQLLKRQRIEIEALEEEIDKFLAKVGRNREWWNKT